jgi:hypothetical protein
MGELNLEPDGYDLVSLLSLCANCLVTPQMGRLARGMALVNEFRSAGVDMDKVRHTDPKPKPRNPKCARGRRGCARLSGDGKGARVADALW